MKIDADLVSPKQVARAIGVSESSLKRWCDRGLIQTVRTGGGHRKIRKSEVMRFVREHDQPLVSPEVLGLPPVSREADLGLRQGVPRLVDALLAGDELLARQVVLDLFTAGHPLAVICDDVLAAAFAQIGERWACRQADVYQERRGVEICRGILFELRKLLPPVNPTWSALGGTLEGDAYTLPSAMAELVLRDVGFAANSLGTFVPASSLVQSVLDTRPKLFWLSVSNVPEGADFLGQFARLSEACAQCNTAVVVGGRALTADLRRQMTYAAFGDNLRHLEGFARSLQKAASDKAKAKTKKGKSR